MLLVAMGKVGSSTNELQTRLAAAYIMFKTFHEGYTK